MARTKNVPKGQELANWQEEVGAEAKAAASTEKPSGGQKISTKGGIFTFEGASTSELEVIVLDYSMENTYYRDKFDSDNPVPPHCFALALAKEGAEDAMAPHENSAEPISDSCVGCPFNQFKSDDNGKGKRCKNIRKLAVIPASRDAKGALALTPEVIRDSKIATLNVPPTCLASWKGFISSVAKAMRRPPVGVVTNVKIERKQLGFDLLFSVPDDGEIDFSNYPSLWPALVAKREEAREILLKPYDKFDPEAQAAPKAGKSAPSARAARFTGKPAAAPAGKGALRR